MEYWTPKRMANATPMPLQQGSPSPREISDEPLPPNRSPRPATGAAPVLPSDHAVNGPRRGEGTGVITPLASFAQEWTGPSTRPPATTTGKLFFRNLNNPSDPTDDRATQCSASTVNSPAKNTVITAGHCVHGGANGTWHDNFVFVPGYRSTSRPFGNWFPKELWSLSLCFNCPGS